MNATPHPDPATPEIRPGTHLDPDAGACLMELVSVAAGAAWSDHPSCTHPLVAHLARRVNDALSDTSRQQLRPLVPVLARSGPAGLGSFAAICLACTSYTLQQRPSWTVLQLHSLAVRHSRRPQRNWLYEHGAAYRTMEICVSALTRLPSDRADQALTGLLLHAISALNPVLASGSVRGEKPHSTPPIRSSVG